jgi:hypothetical protein
VCTEASRQAAAKNRFATANPSCGGLGSLCSPDSPDRVKRYAIFFRNRNAQRTKSKIDIPISTARFGQYSKKCAPRRMIARISAIK